MDRNMPSQASSSTPSEQHTFFAPTHQETNGSGIRHTRAANASSSITRSIQDSFKELQHS